MKQKIRTISWQTGKVKIIDQTLLPHKLKYIDLKTYKDVAEAIRKMKIRGAPAIGVAGALGIVLGAKEIRKDSFSIFFAKLKSIARALKSTRPTAVNLAWGIQRILDVARKNKMRKVREIKNLLLQEAENMISEDMEVNRQIGKNGAKLVKKGMVILTHCNAGALATAGYGTALGVIRAAHRQGKKIKVFASETRPRLQGARLTAWELKKEKIPFILITDNMAGCLMSQGKIDLVLTGADRIAKNGDTANKIGTYSLAVLAKENKIPFYIAAPFSTIDKSINLGKDIPIEERSPDEVTFIGHKRICPPGTKVLNPAFDVTPSSYIKGIITEKGVYKKPYRF